MKGYIYKLTLLENTESFKKDSVYIGQHDGKKPNYFSSGKIIKKIVKKYGKTIFRREIIQDNIEDINLLNLLEVYFIVYYGCNRNVTNTGLNLDNGGAGVSGLRHTKESKAIMSAIKKDKPLTLEHKANIIKSLIGRKYSIIEVYDSKKNLIESLRATDVVRKYGSSSVYRGTTTGKKVKGMYFNKIRIKT